MEGGWVGDPLGIIYKLFCGGMTYCWQLFWRVTYL